MKICGVTIPDDFVVTDLNFYVNPDDGRLVEYIISIQNDNDKLNEVISTLNCYFNDNPQERDNYSVTLGLVEEFINNQRKQFSIKEGFRSALAFLITLKNKIKYIIDDSDIYLDDNIIICDDITIKEYKMHKKIFDLYKRFENDKSTFLVFLKPYVDFLGEYGIDTAYLTSNADYHPLYFGIMWQNYIFKLCGSRSVDDYIIYMEMLNSFVRGISLYN